MKYKSIFLCPLIFFYFFSNALPKKNNPDFFKENYAVITDSIPPKDSVPGLLARIADVFKFKKYAKLKEKNTIISIFQSLGLDSILDTKANVLLLNVMLDSVAAKGDTSYSLLQRKIDTLKLNAFDSLSLVNTKLSALMQRPTDKEIAELTEKILPIVQNKIMRSQKQISSSANDTLNLIKTIYYYTNKKPEAAYLQINRKADVYCFCNSNLDKNYLDFNFEILNNIIFNGYDIANKNAFTNCTGNLKNNRVLKTASDNNCTVFLSLFSSDKTITNAFLADTNKQKKVIEDLLSLMVNNRISGINVMLKDVDYDHSSAFTSFIQTLTKKIKLIIVTIPAFDTQNGYDLEALNKQGVKKIILSFTGVKNTDVPIPIFALNGTRYSLQAAANRLFNSSVPFQNFIISVPYYGVDFAFNKKNVAPYYETLDNLNEAFRDSSSYDSVTASVYAGITDTNGNVTNAIWYDDAATLKEKYTFILNNSFGGIAVEPLDKNFSIGYSNIWNGIANAFFAVTQKHVDTIATKPYDSCLCGADLRSDSIIRAAMIKLGTDYCYSLIKSEKGALQKLIYLLSNPCLCGFNDTANVSNHYFDSLANIRLQKSDPLYYQSYFTKAALSKDSVTAFSEKNKMYLIAYRSAVKRVSLHISLLLLVLFSAALIFYFNRLRIIGHEWKLRKKTEIASIILLNLFLLAGSLFFYLSNNPMLPAGNFHKSSCVQLPVQLLLIIIFISLIVGSAIMRYAVFPFVKNEEVP